MVPEAASELPPAEPVRPFGVGEMPAEIYRFNWGAFFLPQFWGLVYGSLPILLVWLGALLSPVILASLFSTGDDWVPASVLVGVSVVSEIIAGSARLWAGVNATRLLWKRDATRLELVPGLRPRFSVERFVSRQRVWGVAGAALMGIFTAVGIPLTASLWAEYGLTFVGPLMTVVWFGAEVLLGIWLDVRMRAEPWPPVENAAE